MERRIRQVTLAAVVAFGAGCVHVHTDPDGKLKSVEFKTPGAAATAAKTPPAVPPQSDGGVKQAAATVPAPAAAIPSPAKLLGKGGTRDAVQEIAVGWENQIVYQPDVTHNGASVAGLVGKVFLFGPSYQPAPVNGKLVVEMFDVPLPGSGAEPKRLGGWTIDRDTLRRLITVDERFGKCYTLYLPWPDYKPDTTRVRLTTKYEPEKGYPLFATPSLVTINTPDALGGAAGPLSNPIVSTPPAGAANAPFNPIPVRGPATSAPTGLTTPPTPVAPLSSAGPLSPVAPVSPVAIPPGMPPLVITPRR